MYKRNQCLSVCEQNNASILFMEDNDKEWLLKEKQILLEHECLLKDLELKNAALRSSTNFQMSKFEAVRHIRLVPVFVEKDVKK